MEPFVQMKSLVWQLNNRWESEAGVKGQATESLHFLALCGL